MESINNFLATQSLDPLFMIVFCMAFACLLLGFAIGRIFSMQGSGKKNQEAFEKGKIESNEAASREKAEISSELEKELLKIRESIILSARAYENTVKVVQEKLLPATLTLDNLQDSQLTLDFKQKPEVKKQEAKKQTESKIAAKEIHPETKKEDVSSTKTKKKVVNS